MSRAITVVSIIAVAVASMPVAAQSVDDLVKDHTLLRTELDRCKQLGMASNDDGRCKTARAAEQKRFFGSGQDTYTSSTPQVYPSAPVPDLAPASPPTGSPPHG